VLYDSNDSEMKNSEHCGYAGLKAENLHIAKHLYAISLVCVTTHYKGHKSIVTCGLEWRKSNIQLTHAPNVMDDGHKWAEMQGVLYPLISSAVACSAITLLKSML